MRKSIIDNILAGRGPWAWVYAVALITTACALTVAIEWVAHV